MTPKFTTPCYVWVDNSQEAKELLNKLNMIGYQNGIPEHWVIPNNEPLVISAEIYDGYCEYCWYELSQSNIDSFCGISIDCGANTELFLALAGMRSDVLNNQLCVCLVDKSYHPDFEQSSDMGKQINLYVGDIFNYDNDDYSNHLDNNEFRRATATEILEHFNKK